jgi:mannose-1-phosphate guanylyltransferase
MLHAVIMAGGGGTRFWPRSRQAKPKQFLTLAGERSLLQSTFERIEAQATPARTWLMTGAAYRDEAQRQLPSLPVGQIIGEPFGRDTAAAVGLSAALVARVDAEATVLVMPADHVIEPAQEFRRAVHAAEALLLEHPQALVTFGIAPTHPATGYGYIQRGPELAQRQGVTAYRVQAFREKPDAQTAQQFLASGQFYWNSGIFAWRVATILDQLRQHAPAVASACERIAAAWDSPQRDRVFREEYSRLDKISIDYAVMERAREVLVLQAPFRWDDVGSWLAVERLNPQDAHGNTVLGTHTGLSTRNCVIVGDSGKLITTIGVRDLIIVQDGDCLLIADRNDEGAVKQLVDRLKQVGLEQYL